MSEALKPPTIQLTASLIKQAEERAMQVFSRSVMQDRPLRHCVTDVYLAAVFLMIQFYNERHGEKHE